MLGVMGAIFSVVELSTRGEGVRRSVARTMPFVAGALCQSARLGGVVCGPQ